MVSQPSPASEDFPSVLTFLKTLKSPVSFSFKSVSFSVALSLGVSALVATAWGLGLLASPDALFMFDDPASRSVPPQVWVVLLLIAFAGVAGGFALERLGARRALQVVAVALVLLCATSLSVSRFLHIDIVFAPMMLASLGGSGATTLEDRRAAHRERRACRRSPHGARRARGERTTVERAEASGHCAAA
jgi:hypothetical protein